MRVYVARCDDVAKQFRVRAIDTRSEHAISGAASTPGVVGTEIQNGCVGAGRGLRLMRHRRGRARKERRDLAVRVYRAQLLQSADVLRVDDRARCGNPLGSRPDSAVDHANDIVKAGTVEIEGDDVEAVVPVDQSGDGALRNDAEMSGCGK